ncbi:MAG: ABC transporter permease [Bacteroidetes bacterium]|nr:MAG: ABC transporter permease [Bacteroidota bacterium]
MKVSNELKVGVLGVLAITLLILGYSLLKGKQFFVKSKVIYAIYEDVSGLSATNPVQINGYKIGKVMKLELLANKTIKATLNVDRDVTIPSNSIAKIISADLLGSKAIELVLGDSPKNVEDGSILDASIEKSLQQSVNETVLPVKKKAEALLASMDSVLTLVTFIFNQESRANIEASFASINKTLQTFEHASSELNKLITSERANVEKIFEHMESITANLDTNNKYITRIIKNTALISDTLVKADIYATINKANVVFTQVSEIVEAANKGEGSIGLLLKDDQIYNNFAGAIADLDKLLTDMRLNPDRYVHFSLIDFGGGKNNKGSEEQATKKKKRKGEEITQSE